MDGPAWRALSAPPSTWTKRLTQRHVRAASSRRPSPSPIGTQCLLLPATLCLSALSGATRPTTGSSAWRAGLPLAFVSMACATRDGACNLLSLSTPPSWGDFTTGWIKSCRDDDYSDERIDAVDAFPVELKVCARESSHHAPPARTQRRSGLHSHPSTPPLPTLR